MMNKELCAIFNRELSRLEAEEGKTFAERSVNRFSENQKISKFTENVSAVVNSMPDDVLPLHLRYYGEDQKRRFKTELVILELSRKGELSE